MDTNVRHAVVGVATEAPATTVEPSRSVVGTAEAVNAQRVSERQ